MKSLNALYETPQSLSMKPLNMTHQFLQKFRKNHRKNPPKNQERGEH